jgi:hypothetical protein
MHLNLFKNNTVKHKTNQLFQNLQNIIITVSTNADLELSLSTYKNQTLELSTFLKLHSAVSCDTAIDCVVIDSLENAFRFTLIYIIQSSLGNNNYYLITKTNNIYPVISLQSVYPAFN